MKKLIISFSLISTLLTTSACSPEDAATAAGVGAGLLLVASISHQDSRVYNGNYYYRTPGCNRNFEYYDAYGRVYYPYDCRQDNGKYWVSFGTILALGLLVYR